MAYQVFVQQVAFLEGLKNLTLAKETLPVTLENIHARVSALERLVMGHPQPPPTTIPDWESLRYRTTRLYRTPMGGGGPRIYALVVLADHWWPSAEESDEHETAVALERTLRSLGVFSYSASVAAGPKKEVVDDGETVDGDHSSSTNQFNMAVQEFCHLAGQKRKQPMQPLETARDLYAAAFELSLVLEGKPASPVQYPPPPGYHAPALPNTGMPGMPGGTPPGVRPPGAGVGVPPPPPRWNIVQVEKSKKKKKQPTKSTGGLLQFMAGRKATPKCTREHLYSDSDSDADDDSVRARTGWRRWLPRWLCRGRSKKTWNGYDTDSSSGSSSLAD
ncbi:hypothetical protein PG988_016106 [Apiospora saccharicola]